MPVFVRCYIRVFVLGNGVNLSVSGGKLCASG